jgi:hypothetical protein
MARLEAMECMSALTDQRRVCGLLLKDNAADSAAKRFLDLCGKHSVR